MTKIIKHKRKLICYMKNNYARAEGWVICVKRSLRAPRAGTYV